MIEVINGMKIDMTSVYKSIERTPGYRKWLAKENAKIIIAERTKKEKEQIRLRAESLLGKMVILAIQLREGKDGVVDFEGKITFVSPCLLILDIKINGGSGKRRQVWNFEKIVRITPVTRRIESKKLESKKLESKKLESKKLESKKLENDELFPYISGYIESWTMENPETQAKRKEYGMFDLFDN